MTTQPSRHDGSPRSLSLQATGRVATRTRWRLRAVSLAVLAGLVIFLIASPRVAQASEETLFTLGGRGWGHGVGMSQYGARGYASHGWTYRAILRHFYTGISFGARDNRFVRVLLADEQTNVRVTSSRQFIVTNGSTSKNVTAGVVATVTWSDEAYQVTAGATTWIFTTPVTFRPGSQPLRLLNANQNGWPHNDAGARYRGTLRIEHETDGFTVVNRLRLESYLRGVVPREMPSSWPMEALKAQAVVARAYALRSIRDHGAFDLFCTTASQVYKGYDAEADRTTAAVSATAGVVPLFAGTPIAAYYFSTSGGHTENVENVWVGTPVAYLRGVHDPYDTLSPYHVWPNTIRFSGASVAAKLGELVSGGLTTLYVTKRGVSPRVVRAYVIGTGGDTAVSGWTLRNRLGLRDSWFWVRSMSISPTAADSATMDYGQSTMLRGRTYPAATSSKRVILNYYRDGAWHSAPLAIDRVVQRSFIMGGGTTGYAVEYSFPAKPPRNTTYYFSFGSARSPKTTISVRPVVSLFAPKDPVAAGDVAMLNGTVKPLTKVGDSLTLERFDGSGWVSVAQATIAADGGFEVFWSPPAGTHQLRAQVPAGDQMAAAMSPEVQLTAE